MRLELRLKLREAADAIGMTKELWSSYEYGRAPVLYMLGDVACARFRFSQRWLATGKSPRWHHVPIPKEVEDKLRIETLFSEAYDRALAPLLEEHYKAMAERAGLPVESLDQVEETVENLNAVLGGAAPELMASKYVREAIGYQNLLVPDHLAHDYFKAMLAAGRKFLDAHQQEVKEHDLRRRARSVAQPISKKTKVDNKAAKVYTSATDMKTRWKDYQKKLKQLCEARGTKAAIAKKLKVSRTMVAKWVDGSEPSYDLAIELIKWIDANWKARPET